MKNALPRNRMLLCALIFTLSACQFGEVFQSADCLDTHDCSPGDVCFYGRCTNPGGNITEVFIDFTPPNSSALLPQMDLGSPRNLVAEGLLHDFILRSSIEFPGVVQTEEGEPRPGTLTAIPRHGENAVPLPSSQAGVQTTVAESGFQLAVVPGQYDLAFEPAWQDSPRPPTRWTAVSLADQDRVRSLDLNYPLDSTLIQLNGRLMLDETLGIPLVGAEVRGMVNDDASRVTGSTPDITDDSGRFSITFPPSVGFYDLDVTPSATSPAPSLVIENLLLDPEAPSTDLDLDIPSTLVSVLVGIRKEDGSPEPDAKVLFRGSLGTALAPGEFLSQSRSASDGTVRADLYPGLYTITALPLQRSNSGIGRRVVCIATAEDADEICGGPSENFEEEIPLQLPDREPLEGLVLSHDGQRVPGARVVFSYPREVAAREFTTQTDENGAYSITLAPLLDPEQSYEVVVEPPLNLGFPRFRQMLQLPLPQGRSHIVTLYRPSLVSGVVRGPDQAPLADVVVSLYSTELGTKEEPLLVGLGRSTEQGQFVIALPTLE